MSELIRKPYKITLWEDRNVYFYTKTVTTVTIPDNLAGRYTAGFSASFNPNTDYMSIVNGYIRQRDWENAFYYAGIRDHKLNTWQGETHRTVRLEYLDLYGSTTITYTKSYEQIDDLTQVLQNQCLEEVCIATIGSDVMDTPIRVFNPILTEELNGSKTFSFQINYRYWDDEEEDFKLNPFINLLVNERKVKLKYDNNWYDFVIKQIDENSDSNIFTYTCKDLFINELGKTGYEVELDTELRNNMGTITELANSILKGTDWQVDEDNCDPLIQRNKEGLYSFITNSDISATNILEGTSKTIPSGKVILIFYSCKANKDNPIQFLYKEQGDYSTVDEAIANFYKIDEYGFVVDADNYEFIFSGLGNLNTLDAFYNSLTSSSYFGQKIIKKQEMHYLPQIEETCTVWTKNNNRYYCYKELEYASVAQVQNMLSNSSGFISTNGWIGQVGLSTVTDNDGIVQRAIHLDSSTYNTGFYDNRQLLSPKGFVNGEKYIVAVKGTGTLGTSTLKLVDKTNPNSETTVLTFSQTTGFTTPDELDGYTVKMATCGSTISYSTIINNYGDIRFYLGYSGDLIDCKVFKYRTDLAGKMIVPDLETEANTIIQTRYNFFLESSIPNNAIYTKQDLTITESLLDTTTGYEPVMIDGCQKVTSITGSKSNRFNLIQLLCEVFECWAKFTIEHDGNGKITYKYITLPESEYVEGGRYYQRISGSGESSNDSFFKIYKGTGFRSGLYKKVYSKYITFKEYIGEDNPTGFRYGINLQSIQRNVVSDQIASKVIVQANSNEFAPNGSCTIQQSVLNPTGENALYNFQYFINHGLLDATSLYDDLYGTNGGLGFYTKMKQYNDSIQPKIQELSEISKSLYTLNSRQTVYDALIEEATKLRDDASLELNTVGYNKERNYTTVSSPSGNPKKKGWYEKVNSKYVLTSDKTVQNEKTYYQAVSVGATGSSNAPEYVDEIRKRINSYINTIDYYETLSQRNKTLLDAYTEKYNTINEDLASIRALKDKLNQDFANKYYCFIQEGTWNSEDYWDPELYYQAANMILYTSSFPQVSYSINVLEISEIEGFEAYKFKIADKTYIEDTEFFGYDSKGRPYKEEIVVSQVTRHLDDNSQNTITVQNYKTQFQDLFQRIAATSQSLQYHEGAYQRAASAINNDGTINSALLQNSLEANALVIQNANNQSVVWDETGITISNFINANEIVRLTSQGIVLSSNGGKDWTTGITGDGINADVITAGRIDTDRIRIFNAAMQQTFEWNSTGINAYMSDDNIVNYGKFVRFDQYGLYGYAGGNPAWDPRVEDNGSVGINKVIRDSIFSLTWKGLSINVPSSQTDPVITVGNSDNPTFQIRANGDVTLAGNITWGESSRPTTTKVLYAASKLNIPNPNTNYGENNSQIVKIEQVNAATVNTENGWKKNLSITNPDTNYDGVYQSTNQGIATSYSVAKITFRGFTTFKVYIRSNAESTYDYTIASILDPTGIPTSTTSNNAKAHTSGNQQSGNLLSNYTEVTYENISSGIHNIYIIYRKDGSNNINDDSGYFLIPKSANMVWHTTFDPTFDTYASYSYDNGNTWTSPISVSIDSQSVYNALVQNNNGKMGIFYIKSSDSTDGGQLYINADYIKAGSITADRIHGGTLSGITLNINNKFKVDSTGALTIGSNFSVDNTGVIEAKSGYFDDNIYLGTLGNGNRGSIASILTKISTAASNASTAATQAQNAVNAVADKLDAQSSGYGGIDYYSGSGTGQSGKGIKVYANNGPYLTATANGVAMQYNSSYQLYIISDGIHLKGAATMHGDFTPDTNGTRALGYSNYRWHSLCAATATINTSDKTEKKDINYDLSKYESLIKDLKPVSYKFNNGHRDHIGFIAQDIEESLIKNNIDSEEFAGFVKEYIDEEGKYFYGLRYSEFIALQQWQIQKLESRIKTLENLLSS